MATLKKCNMSDREFILEYMKSLSDVSFDQPFENDFDTTVLRHTDTKRWFGIIMNIPEQKIGRDTNNQIDILNVKSRPEDSLALFELYPQIIPAYHMNKTHWVTVPLDGSLSHKLITFLINKSIELTQKKK